MIKAHADDPNNNPFQCTSFPNSFKDLHDCMKTGNKSFLQSFPHNKPRALKGHATTGLIAALECILASGVELPDLANSCVGSFPAASALDSRAASCGAIPIGL